MKRDLSTLKAVSRAWNEAVRNGQPPPAWMLGDFIDDFRLRAKTGEEKAEQVADEPEWLSPDAPSETDAYWAAVAETLCREARLPPPAWTESPRRFLSHPWFAGGLENLKAILLSESPAPFRRRNLFVSANAMFRV